MQEPIWNAITDAVVAALKKIKKASGGYWTEIRHVYEESQSEYDKTRLPALEVIHVPAQSRRANVGGSQTVNAEMAFVIRGILRNDPVDAVGPRKQIFRVLQDIHKALLTTDRKLGLARVKGITFPVEPVIDSGGLTGETDKIVLEYGVSILYSYEDNLP